MKYSLWTALFFWGAIHFVVSGSAWAQGTVRVSVDSNGIQVNNGSTASTVSQDGRYIAFQSVDNNLVAGDTNGTIDIFVHDRDTDEDGVFDEVGNIETVRVSIRSDGNQGTGGNSTTPTISPNGRFVAFQSVATNLVAGDTNGFTDIFVHDRDTDEDGVFDEVGNIETVRVSIDSGGNQVVGNSENAAISQDGRHVAFQSNANLLVAGDTNGSTDVFVHDRDTDEDGVFDEAANIKTVRVSVASDGSQALGGNSTLPRISQEVRYITFQSVATNLVVGDNNGLTDVFLHDRDTDSDYIFDEAGNIETERISVDSSGTQANGNNQHPAISQNGRYVIFQSNASNLVSSDTNGSIDIFDHDRSTGETTRISVDSDGNQVNGNSQYPVISQDGRYVTFHSSASNLVSFDTNGLIDIFDHDRNTGQTTRVSVDSDGKQANGDSQYPAISQDGQYVAFESKASNLVLGDTNGNLDIFAYDFQSTPDDPGGVGNLPGGSGGSGGCFINTIANDRQDGTSTKL